MVTKASLPIHTPGLNQRTPLHWVQASKVHQQQGMRQLMQQEMQQRTQQDLLISNSMIN